MAKPDSTRVSKVRRQTLLEGREIVDHEERNRGNKEGQVGGAGREVCRVFTSMEN